MVPLCTPHFYFDQDIFLKEQEILFRGNWQFIGFKMEVEKHSSYLCRKIGGKSVIVRNFRGMLKAFHNVCSHRSSRIHSKELGSGSFQCPYHGWTYDSEGIPSGIPSASEFEQMSDEQRKNLRLNSWMVDYCGQFIFVKERNDNKSLKSFLGKTYDFLEQISEGMNEKVDLNRYTVKANWKIVVENTLESYHARIVHPQSFGRLGTSGYDFRFDGAHSTWFSPVSEQTNKNWARVKKIYESRPFHNDGYFHHLLFPNVSIVSMYGTSFSVQHYAPITSSETLFSSYVFSTKLDELLGTDRVIFNTMNDFTVKFDRDVFYEDQTICEQVQLGMEESLSRGILSKEEERVFEFQSAYKSILEDKGKVHA